MLAATDGALEHLAALLDDHGTPEGHGRPLRRAGEELALVPATQKPGDVVLRHENHAVLVIAKDLCDGREFDIDDAERGRQATLR